MAVGEIVPTTALLGETGARGACFSTPRPGARKFRADGLFARSLDPASFWESIEPNPSVSTKYRCCEGLTFGGTSPRFFGRCLSGGSDLIHRCRRRANQTPTCNATILAPPRSARQERNLLAGLRASKTYTAGRYGEGGEAGRVMRQEPLSDAHARFR